MQSNCDAVARNCDEKITATRNCVAVFRNYGSQCDRSYGVTVSQLRVTTIKKITVAKKYEIANVIILLIFLLGITKIFKIQKIKTKLRIKKSIKELKNIKI